MSILKRLFGARWISQRLTRPTRRLINAAERLDERRLLVVDVPGTIPSEAYDQESEAGLWREYSIRVSQPGSYEIAGRIASSERGERFHIEFDGVDRTGSMEVPTTGAASLSWTTISSGSFWLTKGAHAMRVCLDTGTI